jgi:hypothetical protein
MMVMSAPRALWRLGVAAAAAAWVSGCAAAGPNVEPPASPPKPSSTGSARFEVGFDPRGILTVEIEAPAGTLAELTIERGAEDYVSAIEVAPGGGAFEAVENPAWPLRLPACKRSCSLRYRFDLASAARDFDNPQFADALGGGYLAPPTTWLLRPSEATPRPFELTVKTPPGSSFVSGLARRADGSFGASLADLSQAPYSAFGPFTPQVVEIGDARIDVVRVGPEPAAGDAAIVEWVAHAGGDIAALLGGFAQPRTLVLVVVGGGQSIANGSALGNGGASIIVHIGAEAARHRFADDWILTHELVHVVMPGLASKHSWMEEGMATFLEPVARARAGRLSASEVWSEWYYAMWQGQPLEGDKGLDGTRSWGRLYWGGAAFWLMAEVAILEKTHGEKSVRDCLRGANRDGGTIAARFSVERFLTACDKELGQPIVAPLYAEVAERAVTFDLDSLFTKLGVRKATRGVELDDSAPAAGIRKKMLTPR